MALPANGQYAYTYDGLKRLTTRSLSLNGNGFLTKGYTYVPGAGTNSTTMLVGGLTNKKGNTTLNSYTYTYDNVGNITAIGGTTPATYTYDSHGQMLTETVNGVTYTYTYDTYGNIRSVSDGVNTYTYTYGDSNWKDLLTAYCGQSITYDQIGNPTHWYNGNNFTWVNGRRLAMITASSGGTVASYTYDVDGLRQTKTVGGVEHRYVWQGNKLVSEYWDGKELEFFYDESGMPYAFSYKSSSSATPAFYYYVTNLQGDVVKILTASGTEVANYSYNAWGKLLSSSGTMASVNPIRYRGYYFDAETGLYYVSSRYYDPEICRWINADSLLNPDSVLGNNLFAYCLNNPVNLADTTGELPVFLVTAAVGAVAGAIIGGVNAAKNGRNVWAGIGIGAAAGGLAGAGLGAAAGVMLAGSVLASNAAVVSNAGLLATTVSTGGAGAGLALVADNISRAVNNVGTVLYSGGDQARQVATTFANNTGGTTIDPTVIGQVADAAANVPGADFTTVWSQASVAFCYQASGVVNAFVSNSAYRGVNSIFWRFEMPTLLNNPRVTEIIIHIF